VIYRILLKPWDIKPALQSQKNLESFRQSIRTVASVLFVLTFEYLKSTVGVPQTDNQKHLDLEKRIKPSQPLKIFDEYQPDEDEMKRKKDEIDLIMIGIYKKDQIIEFLQKKPLLDPLKALLTGWCDKIYDIMHRIGEEKAKNAKEKKK